LFIAARSANAAERSATSAEESVGVAKEAADSAKRSAEAPEAANLLTRQGFERLQRTRLVVEGWSSRLGGLLVTNPGPGAARELLIVLAHPKRYRTFGSLRANVQDRFEFEGPENGWPNGFAETAGEPPARAAPGDVAFVRWRNDDDSIDQTGWVQAPDVPR
jgi:hypothetical protein